MAAALAGAWAGAWVVLVVGARPSGGEGSSRSSRLVSSRGYLRNLILSIFFLVIRAHPDHDLKSDQRSPVA